MYRPNIVLGVMPTKRGFLSMEEAKRQKDAFMAVIRSIKPKAVTIIDIDDLCENGIAFDMEAVPRIIHTFKEARIDALFVPFCDFGEESVVATVAAALALPTLIWGNRDETVNTDASRGRDTQCGMFAATKVLRRHGVMYSYIFNCETGSDAFKSGFERFIRVVAVLKDLRGLRIAKIGERPQPFMSVMTNEAALIQPFGITTVPIAPETIVKAAEQIRSENREEFQRYYADVTARMDTGAMEPLAVQKAVAFKLATQQAMLEHGCTVAAMECWSGCSRLLGAPVCLTLGELADQGLPIACETDINGAITLAMMRACLLGEEAAFLADLTVRHPQNDNAELLWHCGPFPYSLKAPKSKARLIDGQERWELKQGDLTLCRFDDIDGQYYLFAGEGKTTTGPETTGTYVWLEVDDWKRWEEKLMFGPYIHHIGGMYGTFLPVLREVSRYLGIRFDTVDSDGPRSL
ncbi:MAG: fucose isomerase [Clostridia bacterium]|nr:fucose isomerase [Clostridia bacterium]